LLPAHSISHNFIVAQRLLLSMEHLDKYIAYTLFRAISRHEH